MTELVEGVHRIEAEVGGRPLYLFLFLGERRLLLDAGCARTVGQFIVPSLAELGVGVEDLDLLLITHSDLDPQGGTRGLRQANPSLWVACGVIDVPLVSDPSKLIAERYHAYLEDHAIKPDWPPHRGSEALAFIDETRAYVRHVDELVRPSVDQPLTLEHPIARVNEQLDSPWPDELAPELVYSLHGHAEWLIQLGLATRKRGGDGRITYRMTR